MLCYVVALKKLTNMPWHHSMHWGLFQKGMKSQLWHQGRLIKAGMALFQVEVQPLWFWKITITLLLVVQQYLLKYAVMDSPAMVREYHNLVQTEVFSP